MLPSGPYWFYLSMLCCYQVFGGLCNKTDQLLLSEDAIAAKSIQGERDF